MFKWLSELTFGALLALAVLLVYLSRYLPASVTDGSGPVSVVYKFWLLLPEYGALLMAKIYPFSFVLSFILTISIINTLLNLMKVRGSMLEATGTIAKVNKDPDFHDIKNPKWQKVILHINSENQSDWKLAILECDIMLSELLEGKGYLQPSLGDKLKAVDPNTMHSLDAAWEAHKIRNAVAHEGSEFVISHREAKRVIGLYETVFQEFKYI